MILKNPMIMFKITKIQMSIFSFQQNLAEYLKSEESIIANKDTILVEFENIKNIKKELSLIKVNDSSEDIIKETKDLIMYLEMLQERLANDLSDLNDKNKVNDLLDIGKIFQEKNVID